MMFKKLIKDSKGTKRKIRKTKGHKPATPLKDLIKRVEALEKKLNGIKKLN